MGKKGTDAEVEQRTMEVYHCLLIGKRRAEILQYASEKDWKLTDRQIDTYIARANRQFAAYAAVRRERELGKAVERLNYLFMKALNISDYKTALSIQKEINVLLGLNAPEKLEVKVDDASLTDETRATRITELLDAAAAKRDGRAADDASEYIQ